MSPPLRLITGPLAAAAVVVVTQILTVDRPDKLLFSAVLIFAIDLPFLVGFWLKPPTLTSRQVDPRDPTDSEAMAFLDFCCLVLLEIVGFTLVFFHFGLTPGVLFVVCVLLTLFSLVGSENPKGFLELLLRLPAHPFQRVTRSIQKLLAKRKPPLK